MKGIKAKIFTSRRAMPLVVGTENHVVARGGSDVKGQAVWVLMLPNPGRRIYPRGRGISAALL